MAEVEDLQNKWTEESMHEYSKFNAFSLGRDDVKTSHNFKGAWDVCFWDKDSVWWEREVKATNTFPIFSCSWRSPWAHWASLARHAENFRTFSPTQKYSSIAPCTCPMCPSSLKGECNTRLCYQLAVFVYKQPLILTRILCSWHWMKFNAFQNFV